MKPYVKNTLWVTAVMGLVILLIVLGGWRARGYFTFDAGFIILLFSPLIIMTWYDMEKEEYKYRRTK